MDGKEHGWGFLRDGEEKQVVGVEVDATEGVEKALAKVKLGLKDLLGERAKSRGEYSPSQFPLWLEFS